MQELLSFEDFHEFDIHRSAIDVPNANKTTPPLGQDTSSCCHTARMAPKMLDANAKMKAEIEAAGSLKNINGPVRRFGGRCVVR